MKMVVTGGAGYIGSHLVNRLVSHGYEVHVIDNLTTGVPERLHSEAILHVADAGSKLTTDYIKLLKPDVVFHLGGQTDAQRSIHAPAEDAEANIKGTLNVLDACKAASVRKIVYSSVCNSWNSLQDDISSSFVTLSKLAAEQYIRLYGRFYGVNYTILRYGYVYGPGQPVRSGENVIAWLLESIGAGLPIDVQGDGTQMFDFLYVQDVVDALITAIRDGNREVVNLSSGSAVPLQKVIGLIQEELGRNVEVRFSTDGLTNPPSTQPLEAKDSRSSFKWAPQYTLESGLFETFRYDKLMQS